MKLQTFCESRMVERKGRKCEFLTYKSKNAYHKGNRLNWGLENSSKAYMEYFAPCSVQCQFVVNWCSCFKFGLLLRGGNSEI